MMKRYLCTACFWAAALYGQDGTLDKVTVPLSDPSRPGLVKVSLVNGTIHVSGYDGKDIIVESKGGNSRRRPTTVGGLRRIDVPASGLIVEEQNNSVRVTTGAPGGSIQVSIQVPRATSRNLHSVNGSGITVDGVSGEMDIDTVNGGITLTNVSGAVVAHAVNNHVKVTLDRAAEDKPMSFSSLNGDVDVALPSTVKARVKMKSTNGAIYTDFEIKMDAGARPGVAEGRTDRGKYQIKLDRTLQGSINGGGPEMTFTTLNGKIFLRKK
jgi:DUF4097 and DUF4098 domain-containing protein YvlB